MVAAKRKSAETIRAALEIPFTKRRIETRRLKGWRWLWLKFAYPLLSLRDLCWGVIALSTGAIAFFAFSLSCRAASSRHGYAST